VIDRLRHPETAFSGPWAGGWMIDRFGRRVGFAVLLIDGVELGLYRRVGPVTAYTAEMYPTRIRGVGNGFSWAVAFVIGAVLWPFVSVYLRETTGSFVAAFLLIPVILLAMAGIIWFYSPEHARKELDQISV